MSALPYTVITCQGINGLFVCPEQPLFCEARIPWQGLGKLQDSGFLFGADMKEIPLTKGNFAIVDDEDFEELNKRNWRYRVAYGIKYAYSGGMLMHRVIMNPNKGEMIDHINGNGLDNRKSNLRICTNHQNQGNRKKGRNNTSGYKGVDKCSTVDKWQARIRKIVNGKSKQIHLGLFNTKEEAARAYDKKAKELFGEFARLNFPEG